jgi:hypothetical protein
VLALVPYIPKSGPVAQGLERAAHNRLVGGSIPPGPTTPEGALIAPRTVGMFKQ